MIFIKVFFLTYIYTSLFILLGFITNIVFSSDGKYMASGSWDCTVNLIDMT